MNSCDFVICHMPTGQRLVLLVSICSRSSGYSPFRVETSVSDSFNNNIKIVAIITNEFSYGYIIRKPFLKSMEFINFFL